MLVGAVPLEKRFGHWNLRINLSSLEKEDTGLLGDIIASANIGDL